MWSSFKEFNVKDTNMLSQFNFCVVCDSSTCTRVRSCLLKRNRMNASGKRKNTRGSWMSRNKMGGPTSTSVCAVQIKRSDRVQYAEKLLRHLLSQPLQPPTDWTNWIRRDLRAVSHAPRFRDKSTRATPFSNFYLLFSLDLITFLTSNILN